MTLTTGALYYHSKSVDGGLPGFPSNFSFTPVPAQIPLGGVQESSSKTDSVAGYAQAELHLSSKFDVVAGGRITRDKKDVNLDLGGTFVGSRTDGTINGIVSVPNEFKKTKPSFSLGLNFTPDDFMLLYGKYSTAFLSGGAVGTLEFEPETVKSWEVGFKAGLFDQRLQMNLALYDATYDHLQSAQSGSVVRDPNDPTRTLAQFGVVVIDNGTLKAKGVELDLTAMPIDRFVIGASVGYADSKLTSPNPLVAQGQPYKQTGTPEWIGTAYAQYETRPLFGDAVMFFRLDGNYQGQYRGISNPNIENVIPAFAPYEFVPSRWILNGRVALREISLGQFDAEIGAWGRNLTDNRDVLYQLQFGDFQVDSSFQPARTYGVDVIVNF